MSMLRHIERFLSKLRGEWITAYSSCKNPGMVKDTYQGMKVFIEQLSFDVPRGSLPNLYSAFMITILGICSGLDCLGNHTSIVGPIVGQVLG